MPAARIPVIVVVLVGMGYISAKSSAEPPPLTEEQRDKVSRLARETQQEAAHLKALLERRQQELAAAYAEYELDEQRVSKLEAEVLEAQKQMLANYRRMQTELRTVVGKERFAVLRKRIDHMLQTPPDSSARRPEPSSPDERRAVARDESRRPA